MNVVNTIEIWSCQNLSKIRGIESKFYGDVANTSQKLLGEVELTEEISFLGGEVHTIKIEYDSNIKVYIDTSQEPILSVPVNISDILPLEHGACFVGIC